MKVVLKQNQPGVSIVEVAIVLTISAIIFVLVIGTFSARRRASSDDAARQVVSQIQTIQNEAQKGLGPVTDQGKALLDGNRIFGELIAYKNDCGGHTCLRVYKLMQGLEGSSTQNTISAYESYDVTVPGGLQFYLDAPTGSAATACTNTFLSCYQANSSLPNQPLNTGFVQLSSATTGLGTVTQVITGKNFVFGFDETVTVNGFPAFTPDINTASKYALNTQSGKLRLAVVSATDAVAVTSTLASSAQNQYYLNLNLAVNGDVSLEVLK